MGKKGKGKKGGGEAKPPEGQQAGTSQPQTAGQQPPAEPAPAPQQPPPSRMPQQQPGPGQGPPQQQPPPAWGHQQQQPGSAQGPPQQQPPPGWAPQQQQPGRGRGQQQGRGRGQQQGRGRGQEQSGRESGPPEQQQQPPPEFTPQQQQGRGRGQQQGRGRGQQQGRGRGQQQSPPGQQQQPPPGWAPQQQPGPGQGPQQQPPPAWGPQQQQPGQGPPQQQPPPAWGSQQQPGQGPPQQQPPPGWAPQQQQQGRGRGQQGRGRGQQQGRGGAQEQPGREPGPPAQQQQPPPGWTPQQSGRGRGGTQKLSRQSSEQSEAGRSATAGDAGSHHGDSRDRTLSPTSSQGSGQQQRQRAPGGDRGPPGPGPSPQERPQRPAQPSLADMPLVPVVKKHIKQGGTRGRKFMIETNHLELKVQPKYSTAIHYDVAITPDKPKRLMRRVWEEYRRQYLPNSQVAFDDVKNAYSPAKLPFGDEHAGEVQVADDAESRPRAYKVVMKYAAMVNLMALFDYLRGGGVSEIPQDTLQCIDIVLRNVSAVRFTRVGRNYFSSPDRIVSLGDGLDLWYGYFQSAILGWKPFLNVDVAHKGFPRAQRVIDLMVEIANVRSPEEVDLQRDRRASESIGKFLKGLKVLYEIPNLPSSRRTFRVNGLVATPADARFVLEDGQPTTVQQYFQTVKGYRIRYQYLPCLHVGPRDKKVYLPAELCTIVAGQVVNKKLNEIQTANMVKCAATSTQTRKDKIMRSLQQINFNADPCVRAFGLSVGTEFEAVQARILDPPRIQYQSNALPPSRGVWRADREKFVQPGSIDNWAVLNMSRNTRDEKIEEFVRMLENSARTQGMNVGRCTRPFPRYEQRGGDLRGLQKVLSDLKSMKLVFVVVPDFPPDVYSKVKQVAELTVGCLTQCIKSKTMFRMSPPTVGNILLKVNAKLNGLNHTIADISRPPCLQVPCMIMGADVTHPSPDQTDIPSVAAVAASYDATAAFRYNFCWRLQPARQEIITDLANIVKQQLLFFHSKTNQKPRRIIFFRDGVSEGQFRYVLNAEVQAIRQACSSLGDGSFQPQITFLVVQKRHHTRFFPKDLNSREVYDQRNYNVPAGTLVDTDIIHPSAVEYYLVSHASIQGVARPTKYRVLWDDANMSDDEIQALTYYLCHMFTRCNRSVSYPAPTYYAHLAAFRARVYLEGQNVNLNNLPREQAMRVIKDELCKEKPMFFV